MTALSAEGREPLLSVGHYVDESHTIECNDGTLHRNTIVFYQVMRKRLP